MEEASEVSSERRIGGLCRSCTVGRFRACVSAGDF